MGRRRGSQSIAANPVLIGAATTLVVLVAVFLAYNANSGLPFVPTYELKAELPDAANLVVGNDVRIGGTRVGTVAAIDPVVRRNGAVVARLTLKLETTVQPLPVDSTVIVRPRSALGLKYVQIARGRDRKSTRLNSSHSSISYAVFCLKKKKCNIVRAAVFGGALILLYTSSTISHSVRPAHHTPLHKLRHHFEIYWYTAASY